MNADRALRAAAIALVLVLGALGLALPGSIAVGGCAWLAFVAFALSGWGWLVVRATRGDDVDFGLRAAWGIAAYLAVAGVAIMLGMCTRPVVLGLVAIGGGAFAWREWVTPQPLWRAVRGDGRALREHPLASYCAIVIGAAVLFHVLGAVVHLDRNPWDDDIAYTPLEQRLLHAGNLIEPFSFRRLAAYGGQTALQALLGARGSIASVHALDRGLCFAIVALLVVGHARARRVPPFWLALISLVLVLCPDIAINTASYWSGALCFYALYRTLALADSPRRLAVFALLAAATCTLRMNYLAVVVPLFAIAYAFRARHTGWRSELSRWRLAIAVAVMAIAPWCVAAMLSNHTFLYPLMAGTWNRAIPLQPTAWSWVDQLSFAFEAVINCEPVVVLPLVFVVLAFARDDRPSRPLVALFLAGTLGFAMLVHGFTSADTYSLWRYAFGYVFVLVLVLAIDAADDDGPVRIAPLARWVLLAALLVQIVWARGGITKRYAETFRDLGEARHAAPEARVEAARYRDMQAAIPAGARVAVLLDDAAYLDFRRNDIINLDTPGFASLPPQMPSFSGAEALRSYFLELGVRYIAFVRSERSRYVFRRDFWVWRLFNDDEVFQTMSAYMIDTIESFAQLATTARVLYDTDGLVVLDLDGPHAPAPHLELADEPARREAFVKGLAEREHLLAEWGLEPQRDLIYSDGVTGITYADGDARPDEPWHHGTPFRWMHRRVHLRVRGDRDMHLVVRGAVNLNAVFTHPRLDVSIDGEPLASVRVDDRGAFAIDTTVPAARLDGWTDVYIVFDAIGDASRDVHDLKIARLEEVVWEPR